MAIEEKRELTMEEMYEVQLKYYTEEFGKKMGMGNLEKIFVEEGYRGPDVYPGMRWSQFETTFIWYANLIKTLGLAFTSEIYHELEYETPNEAYMHVFINAGHNGKRVAIFHPPPLNERGLIENFAYMSFPPIYLIEPIRGSAVTVELYGKSCTCTWIFVNDFTRETTWIESFHIEDGIVSREWAFANNQEIAERFDEEDLMIYEGVAHGEHATRTELLKEPPQMSILKYGGDGKVDEGTEYLKKSVSGAPITEMINRLDRRHFTMGIKIKDIAKHGWDTSNWADAMFDFMKDMRLEILPEFENSTLYLQPSLNFPGTVGSVLGTLQTSTLGWYFVYLALFAPSFLGLNYEYITYHPLPAVFHLFENAAMETFSTTMANMSTGYEIFQPMVNSGKKNPLFWRSREYLWEHGMFRELAMGVPDGCILPSRSTMRMIPPIFAKEGRNIREFLATPPSKEFWELLESDEVGVDRETGRIPSIGEVFRLKFVPDPTFGEPIPIKKFPKIDINVGQTWPLDMTVEKVEIMVDEGYSGLGDNIEHYSKLADKKMGKKDVEVPEFKPLSDYAKSYRKELGEVHPVYLEHL